MRNRLYDAILVEKHGGMLVDVDAVNITEGIKEMVQRLMNDDIDGFVLDRYLSIIMLNMIFNCVVPQSSRIPTFFPRINEISFRIKRLETPDHFLV